ncbi:triose-phosphate isomerase [Novosphingobium sp.]|uniref:triose-phosphate isomerase n=1 Tax=Novosphingobium sp. TaxID=1874826 RepID=UPI0031E388EB
MALRPYIVGNWKMNGLRGALAEARAIDRLAQRYPSVEIALAPPATLLHAMALEVSHIGVGAQNAHSNGSGAFTGEVSAAMLADSGAHFAIVGHSERRWQQGEDDSLVRAKAEAVLAAGMQALVCVGENEDKRLAGQAEATVIEQLQGSLPRVEGAAQQLVVGYEPVWAIGTGRIPTVSEVGAMHRAIRRALMEAYGAEGEGVRILYGGSVTAENAAELLAVEDVGGALVGGASLTTEKFSGIILAAAARVDA